MHKRIEIENCENPVFVIGCPRSGTSMLAWSLAQHPEFTTFAETDFIFHLFGQGRLYDALEAAEQREDGGWLKKYGLERTELVSTIGIGLNAVLSSQSRGKRWIDQSPTYTLIANELAELFPSARFLHILRDGRNVVNSMINSGFSMSWASDFTLACKTWADFVSAASAFARTHGDRCRTVEYREIVEQPQAAFKEILEFLDAEYHEAPAAFVTSGRINSSYHAAKPTAEETYKGPRDPWEEWSQEQREVFLREAGPVLVRQGLATASEIAA